MSEIKVKKIHDASMRILRDTGMKFVSEEAQRILKEHDIRVEGDIAYFTEEQIMKYVNMAPSIFEMSALNSENDIVVGGDNVVNGVTIVTSVMERDGTERPADIDDYIKLLKLYETNPKIHINGGLTVEPSEIPKEWKHLVMNYISLCHSEKVLYTAGCYSHQMEEIMELVRLRYGLSVDELKQSPIIFGLASTNTPLILDLEMTETISTCAKYRQPVIIASAAMSGTTAPVTIAGAIALTNAEVIASVALTQMMEPGAPVIYGSQSTVADMRTGGIAIGAPEGALCAKYCAEMARFYDIPSRGGGALSDAKAFDPQAAYEGMLNYYASAANKINVILHAAGVMNGYLSMSFDKVITDFEIIDYVDRYLADVKVDEITIPEDVIKEVGPGGHFLMEDHTFEYCRVDPLETHISAKGTETDPLSFYKNIDKRTEELLGKYEKPQVSENVLEQMKNILRDKGISEEVIAKCTGE